MQYLASQPCLDQSSAFPTSSVITQVTTDDPAHLFMFITEHRSQLMLDITLMSTEQADVLVLEEISVTPNTDFFFNTDK